MKVGDLVKMRRAIAPPDLYGVGIIVEIRNSRCIISWSKNYYGRLGSAAPSALEFISESR
jgi:hypothetical protein